MAKLEASQFTTRDGQQITFRHLAASDAESFLKFRELIPKESTHTMQYVGMRMPTLDETKKRLTDQEADSFGVGIGAFKGNQVIGFLSFWPELPGHPYVKHLARFGMMVLKEFWGQGIGRRLLEIQEAHARSIGIIRIEAMVRTTNERGVALYESFGYKIEGTRRKAANINGEWQDEYFIAKLLDEESRA